MLEPSNPVHAVGQLNQNGTYHDRMPPPPQPGQSSRPTFEDGLAFGTPWPGAARYSNTRPGMGPIISTPGTYHGTQQRMPNFMSKYSQPGYQASHARYEEMRKFFQQQAYAGHGSELVVVKVTMMVREPGRKKEIIVSVCVTASYIPGCSLIVLPEHLRIRG
jgi:hypothetical protein